MRPARSPPRIVHPVSGRPSMASDGRMAGLGDNPARPRPTSTGTAPRGRSAGAATSVQLAQEEVADREQRGAARPAVGQAGVGQDFQPERRDPLQVGRQFDLVGVVVRLVAGREDGSVVAARSSSRASSTRPATGPASSSGRARVDASQAACFAREVLAATLRDRGRGRRRAPGAACAERRNRPSVCGPAVGLVDRELEPRAARRSRPSP